MNLKERINQELNPIVQELTNHRLYHRLKTLDDIRFTQYHVFAVWDFYVFIEIFTKFFNIKLGFLGCQIITQIQHDLLMK